MPQPMAELLKFATEHQAAILLTITALMGAVTLFVWFTWRFFAVWAVRRATRGAIVLGLSAVYAILPFDFLMDPIFIDDLVVLALGFWYWRKMNQPESKPEVAPARTQTIEAQYSASE
jgi:uncharacterized membrane protein YkvA (DUF1232 family)